MGFSEALVQPVQKQVYVTLRSSRNRPGNCGYTVFSTLGLYKRAFIRFISLIAAPVMVFLHAHGAIKLYVLVNQTYCSGCIPVDGRLNLIQRAIKHQREV